MKAVIMAGGEGSRLRPLTSNMPKPMLPLLNAPMMEHIVSLLKRHGFDDIVVTVAYMANVIRTYFGDGSEFGVRMVYATEEHPLGTAGSVRNAMDELDDRFLVISGDVLTDIDLGAMLAFHDEKKALATIGLCHVENPLEEEQPVFGAITDGYWEDVGTLEAYVRAHKDALDAKVAIDIVGFELTEGVWVGENAEVHPEAKVEGPAVIGDYCRIEAGARLGEYTVLGSNVRVREAADLERVVVHDNTYLGGGVRLRGTVVGRACDLRSGVRCEEGVVLGDQSFVGDNAVIGSGVKVYPFKTVEAGAIINTSIVWESRGARSLFGRDGVAGLANVDVTPELATKVAMAYASPLKKDATVITSRDSSRSARMLKRAMMAGLNAGGINVLDLEVASVPVTRFLARQPVAGGGITIRLVENDPQSVVIRFFDTNGLDLSESDQRKVERLFNREDFRRALPAEIGDIGFPPRALEHYTAALEATVDTELIRSKRFKVVVDYAYGSASFVMPNVLAKLGADVLACNPYASTTGLLRYDPPVHADNVAGLVRASGADLGAVLDPDGEHLTLIDDEGHVLTPIQSLLALLELVAGHMVGDKVALPVAVTRHAERMAASHGVEVRYTKMSTPAIMDASTEEGVGFAASLDGGFILPGFLPAFDAAATFVKTLELLARQNVRLSEITSRLPRVHMAHETVVTPWEQKGTVMRSLMEHSKDRDLELVDGVKVIHGDGWALALPDPEEPVTHVWAEAGSDGDARRLAQEYARRIRQ